ncbi:MAG: GntR family transcriptional regulator [Burkholderiaceae bacterium]
MTCQNMSNAAQELAQQFVTRYWREDLSLPKHERLRLAFASSIADGFWRSGMRLPTEAELAHTTPCSLGTIQRALRELAADGLIERRRGSGSVVADLTGKLADPWHIRYIRSRSPRTEYFALHTRVLSRRQIRSVGRWSEVLGQNKESVTRVDRLFTVDGRIDIYAEFFALSSRFPEFMSRPMASMDGLNFKKMIGDRYHAPTHRVHQTLRFQPTPAHVAEVCGMPAGGMSPVLNVVSYPLSGEPIYMQDFYLPLDAGELDLGFAIRLI